jgi:Na+-transporting NADH:ubiquinone oxidoreductase subunit C
VSRSQTADAFRFAGLISIVCAVLVSSATVLLKERQETNRDLDRKRNVLMAAGVMTQDENLPREEVNARFKAFEIVAVDLRTGAEDPAIDATSYDQQRALREPDESRAAPPNDAQVVRLPDAALVYKKLDSAGHLELLVLPIEGKGLWSTLYGYLALGPDLNTVRGLTFYQHGETPGLGGEVDNPRWQALWPGRQVFDDENRVVIQVVRGSAGKATDDPYRVDGLAGATITSRGVTALLHLWLGPDGFGPYLARLKKEGTQ